MSLLKNVKITRVAGAAAAAQTAVNSSILDMQGYDGVLFLAMTGDVTATSVLTLTAQQNTANSTSGITPPLSEGGAGRLWGEPRDGDVAASMLQTRGFCKIRMQNSVDRRIRSE